MVITGTASTVATAGALPPPNLGFGLYPDAPGAPEPSDIPLDPDSTPSRPAPATPTPRPPSASATSPATQGPTPSTSQPTTATSTPSSTPTPTPPPTPTPTPTASPTPVVRPATPAASDRASVPIWSVVIAVAVLLLSIVLLLRFTRAVSEPTGTSPTVSIPQEEASETLKLMTAVGEAMIDSSYDVHSVQSALTDIARVNGLNQAESIALPTAVIVSGQVRGELRTGAAVSGFRQLRLNQIEEVDDLVGQARLGKIGPRQALHQLVAIRDLPAPFPRWLQLVGQVFTAVAIAVLLGASWLGIGVSGLLGALAGAITLAGSRLVPQRYQVLTTVSTAFVVALAVFLLSRTGLDFGILPCLIAPLALLLPGALLTTSVIELSTGQMLAGSARLAAGGMQLVLLALGIVAASALVGIPEILLEPADTPLGPFGPWLAVAVFGLGVVMNRGARPRSLGWILIVLYVAYGAQIVGSLFLGGVLSAFIGAVAMTPVAAVVARQRSGPPAMVSFTPAFWLLVPGALGLIGVTSILDGDSNGTQTLLTTASTMVSIALGVLVGWAITGLVRRTLRRRRSGPDASDSDPMGPEPTDPAPSSTSDGEVRRPT